MSDPNTPPQPTSEMIPLGTDENLNPGGGPEELSGATEAMQGLDLTAAPKTRFSMQMLILAIIICVAGGVLYAMRRVGLAPAAGIAAQPFTHEVPQFAKTANQQSVMADLSASRTQQQVPPDQVKKNPFRMAGAVMMGGPAPELGTTKFVDTTDAAARAAEMERLAHAKSLEQAFKALQLNGVMSGKPPVARINGRLYREGMVVNKQFTVAAIDGLKVKLTADGREFELTIAGADGENAKP